MSHLTVASSHLIFFLYFLLCGLFLISESVTIFELVSLLFVCAVHVMGKGVTEKVAKAEYNIITKRLSKQKKKL